MFNLGAPEIMVILLIALIVIGPKKLPDAGKQLARALREFRRVTTDVRADLQEALGVDDLKNAFDLNSLLGDDTAPALAEPTPRVGVANAPGDEHLAASMIAADVPSPDGYTTELEETRHVAVVDVPPPAFQAVDVLS